MKTMRSPRRHHCIAGVGIFLIVVALVVGMVGCTSVPQYVLTVSSTEGGEVTAPGEGTHTYDEGTVVPLVALPHAGYRFVNWTGDADTVASINSASTTITMNGDYSITASFAIKQYDLTISSREGGSVTTPGEGISTYDEGTVVNLVAQPDEGYQFINWTGDISTIADVNAASTTITMNGGYSVTANFARTIRDWYDLDAIGNNLDGSYILMNDLGSTTAGYEELASPTANQGKSWEPIGSLLAYPIWIHTVDPVDPFTGSLDGQGHEIRDLFVSRPDEDGVGLFGCVSGGVIENLGVVNAEVTGHFYVGGLMGENRGGSVSNSYSTGSVTGRISVGGLVGGNVGGTVSNSYSTCSVGDAGGVGGLVGSNWGTVNNSYSTGGVTGGTEVGGLVGANEGSGTVDNSYSRGSVTGEGEVGGLVGWNNGIVSNSYYSYDEVLINGRNIITIGALSNGDFEQWLANDKSLDVNERLSQEDGYYLISNVNDFKELLAFGQDGSLKFRLKNDLDLGGEPNFYIPYLAGEFDGNGRKISELRLNIDFISEVGLFGYLASGGTVTGVSLENADMTGYRYVGALVGQNDGGTLSNSYATGRVAGHGSVGGLVGWIGWHGGTVSNSYYDYDEVLINGANIITIGALPSEDFEQWLANDKFLDVNERLSQEDGYYMIDSVGDFRDLLVFGQDSSLKFRLKNDLDLGHDLNFYIPYLAGEFDGNGHKITNLKLNFDVVAQVGLFGYLASGGKLSKVGAENVDVTVTVGRQAGGLVGASLGTVDNSYSTGSVSGDFDVGGLVGWTGWSGGTVNNSYSTSSVTGFAGVGGLVGWNSGSVSNSYAVGSVTGDVNFGGLVGLDGRIVSNSCWDTETSGQSASAGGTGKTTAEMKSIVTFSGAGWNIIAVANPNIRSPSYIWNIVDGQTYPFLSWEPVA